jgi:hypothetical protein
VRFAILCDQLCLGHYEANLRIRTPSRGVKFVSIGSEVCTFAVG